MNGKNRFWIIELPCDFDPTEMGGKFCFTRFMTFMKATEAKEAMPVEVPDGFQFSGILEKNGEKSDWTNLKIYAVKEENNGKNTK